MSLKPALSLLLVASALALAACGSDSESEESEKAATPATAMKEIGETRDALTAALATYKGGDHKAAEDQAAEAYVQHFEEVEGPLGKKDAELEEAISQDVRNAMKDGRPAAEVEQTVNSVLADLEKAEAALR
jgi:high-affinity iron transporter